KNQKQNKKISHEKEIESKSIVTISAVENRRTFLKKIWKGLGIIAFLEFAGVFLGFIFSGKDEKEQTTSRQIFNAGSVNSFQPNTATAFRGGRFYLARLEDGGFIALSLRCTHLGCSINWEENKKNFVCPCHSSSFSIDGDVLNPPAPKALDYFPVKIENGIVKVDVGTKLSRNRFNSSQVAYA
ncbi:MAG TPA: Rieske (2Fe-2S) protein, partial [Ignavibacteriaceae bacterium]